MLDKIFKNYNKVFADHLFISEKVLDIMNDQSDLFHIDNFADKVFETIEKAKTEIESEHGRGWKRGIKQYRIKYYLEAVNPLLQYPKEKTVELVIHREWIGDSVIATLMLEEELPVRANPYKPTLRERMFLKRLPHILKKEPVFK